MKNEYHLNSNEQDCLEVKLASAFLEEILKTLAKKVHDHNVENLVFILLLISHEVKVWYTCCRLLLMRN
jgi:hypothetical protein